MADWIWLDGTIYPECEKVFSGEFGDNSHQNYAAADFMKDYAFTSDAEKIDLSVSGDTVFSLCINGKLVASGPPCAGGDFLNNKPAPRHYSSRLTLPLSGKELHITALVRISRVVGTDYSRGHGGFFLDGTVTLTGGQAVKIGTDASWLARRNTHYIKPYVYDERHALPDWKNACITPDIWHTEDAPVPALIEDIVFPENDKELLIPPHGKCEKTVFFDKIYASYICLDGGEGEFSAEISVFELPETPTMHESVYLKGVCRFRSMQLHSVGGFILNIINNADTPLTLRPYIISTHYPVFREGSFICDDEDTNRTVRVCTHTLKICRQTLHLDSPRHQEPLACTGDYNIEMLMEAFAFGDLDLARFDLIRTADLLTLNDGRMFHTTYSLIYAGMLLDYYMLTADRETLDYCMHSISLLLSRFEKYTGDNGLIEHAPDYMFADWIVVDGYSMHHPPKSLGQTILCAFYAGALKNAAELFRITGDNCSRKTCLKKYIALKLAINKLLYDKERGLYISGLCGKTGSAHWLPENSGKRYYLKHANTLCVLYGITEGENAQRIMREVMENDELPDFQPYFAHYVFGALDAAGLYREYAPALMRRWNSITAACDKGLQEGWIKPEESYSFDHSHAWGGTVLYQLYSHCLGLRILEAGYKKISLSPELFDFKFADISVPTPFGDLKAHLHRGKSPVLDIPPEIEVVTQ